MPQLCTRMQNKAAMPERKTMFFGDKKSLAPQLHKFTKTEHCLGASGNPCTAPCTLSTDVCLHDHLNLCSQSLDWPQKGLDHTR